MGVSGLGGLSLSSLDSANAGSALAADLLFDGLTAYRADEERVVPSVALSWSSAEGVHWTFTIDPSRTFSDGSSITATDVVASLTQVARTANTSLAGSRLGVIDGMASFVAGSASQISGLAAPDSHTVSVTTSTPFQELPSLLADPSYGIAPAAANGGSGAAMVGSGPFKVTAVDATHVALDRTSSSAAHLAGIDLMTYANDAAALAAFDRHELDIAPIPASSMDRTPRHAASAALVYLSLNVHSPQMADIDVRKAVLKALDRSKIVKEVPNGRATVAQGFVPEVVHSFGQCGDLCASNAAAAAVTLKGAAGAPQRSFTLGFLEGDDLGRMAEEIKRQLDDAGVTVTLLPQSAAVLSASLAAGTNDMILFGSVGLAPTPDPYLADAFGTDGIENTSTLSSAEVDAAIGLARSAANDRERVSAYAAVERLVLEAAPAIPIASMHRQYMSATNVHDDEPVAGVMFDGRMVWLSKR